MYLRLEEIPDSMPVVISFNEKDDLIYAASANEIINNGIARRKLASTSAPMIKIFWANLRHGDTSDDRGAIHEISCAIEANESFALYVPGAACAMSRTIVSSSSNCF